MSSSSENTSKKMIILKSSDGETFELEEAVALESQTIRHTVEEDCADRVIPLPNVRGTTLSMVIDYLKKHVEAKTTEDDLENWDADFVKVGQETLFDLLMTANYLDIKSLLDLLCQTIADMIKGKSPEEIRQAFHIQDDFPPEEEEEIRTETPWALQ